MFDRNSYDARIAARVPPHVTELVETAAGRVFISPSAYVRQAIVEKLRRDGLDLPADAMKRGATVAGAAR